MKQEICTYFCLCHFELFSSNITKSCYYYKLIFLSKQIYWAGKSSPKNVKADVIADDGLSEPPSSTEDIMVTCFSRGYTQREYGAENADALLAYTSISASKLPIRSASLLICLSHSGWKLRER